MVLKGSFTLLMYVKLIQFLSKQIFLYLSVQKEKKIMAKYRTYFHIIFDLQRNAAYGI